MYFSYFSYSNRISIDLLYIGILKTAARSCEQLQRLFTLQDPCGESKPALVGKYRESKIVGNISVVKIVENTVKLRKQYCGKYLYGYRYVLCKASHLGEKKDDCNIKQMHKYLDGCQYLLTGGQI